MSALRFLVAAAIAGAVACAAACSSPPADSRIGVTAPDEGQFAPVGAFLTHRCGSLDCHGNAQRNLIIYGCEGLRLDPDDAGLFPACRRMGGKDTTPAELSATYRSLVGLEPTVMSAVMSGKGQHPELLTFIRKARGTETHKGGALVVPGDEQDNCMVSWLQGQTNADLCNQAITNHP